MTSSRRRFVLYFICGCMLMPIALQQVKLSLSIDLRDRPGQKSNHEEVFMLLSENQSTNTSRADPDHFRNEEKLPENTRKKNVVFILIDDLGVRDLVCYQRSRNNSTTHPQHQHQSPLSFHETPHIDQLASQGVLFENAYGAAPTCSLSRAGIFTGITPSRLGLYHRSFARHNYEPERQCFQKFNARTLPLHKCTTPLGTAFRQNGYQTGFVGKWHNGGLPADSGFVDKQSGFNHAGHLSTHYAPYLCDNATARPESIKYCSRGGRNVRPLQNMTTSVPHGTCSADHLTDEAIQTLRLFQKETNKNDKPFLLVLSHYAVHYPIESKDVYEQEFEARRKTMGLPSYEGRYTQNVFTRTVQSHPGYAGLLKSVDDSVGSVMNELRSLGIANDTFIVLTSDNGGLASHHQHKTYPPTSNLPFDLGKSFLGEGGIRVPLIISGPGLDKGKRISYRAMGMDLYPTMLDLCELPLRPRDHLDGISLLPSLQQENDILELERTEPLFWQADYEWLGGNKTEYPTAILWGDWKLIERYPNTGGYPKLDLYNIKEDPGEQLNLAQTNPCEVERLHRRLQEWRSEWFQESPYFEEARILYQCPQATGERLMKETSLTAPGIVNGSSTSCQR